ncbi:MAG: hypothetical protein K8S55_05985, partial [Phycisphaerae bacterium]|nr:hypothetical protein [Phycisphaerae bacterium]
MKTTAKLSPFFIWWTSRLTLWVCLVALFAFAGLAEAQDEADTSEPTETTETTPSGTTETTEATKASGVDATTAASAAGGIRMNPVNNTFDLTAVDTDVKLLLVQLSKQIRRNIVTSQGVQGNVTVDLYGVTFDQALAAILRSAGLVHKEEDGIIYVYSAAEFAALQMVMETKVFHLYYLTATDAKALLEAMLTAQGKITITPADDTGLRKCESEKRPSNAAKETIVVFDTKENLKKITRVVAEIDVRPPQVLVEATILSVLLDDDDDMGVDLSILAGNANFNQYGATSNLGANPAIPAAPGVRNFNKIQGRMGTGFSDLQTDTLGGLSLGIVSSNLAMFVRVLEETRDTTMLANPKLMIVNKQYGEVLIGDSMGYIASSETTDTSTTSTVEFLETGTKLHIRPFVGKNDYIRMEIHPEISDGNVTVPAGATVALPNKTTTEITTNVIVRDGKTIVIGGLFQERNIRHRSQIPVLGNIPWAGSLFRNTNDNLEKRELIILITPHLVRYDSDEEIGAKIKKETDLFRLGARRGLMWWNRTRLSDAFVLEARRAMANGEMDKAMWNIDLALATVPVKNDALFLKEKLQPCTSWGALPDYLTANNLIQQFLLDETGTPYGLRGMKPAEKEQKPAEKVEKVSKPTPAVISETKTPKPKIEEPAKEEPAKEEPAGEEPVMEPAKEQPIKTEPAKEEPAREEPAKEEPAKEEPAKEEPAKEEPAKEEPAKEEPAKEEPAKDEPAKDEPAKEEPAK